MRGQNEVTGLQAGDWSVHGHGITGELEQDTKIRDLGVTGVLRASVMGPLRSRQVREIGHWESLGKQRDRVIDMSVGSLRVRGVR